MLDQNNKDFRDFVHKEVGRLQTAGASEDKLLNNIILLVSTGAFGLSINFFINNNPPLKNPLVLTISWVCLALSIFFSALGYFLSREIIGHNIEFLNKRITDKDFLTSEEYDKQANDYENSPLNKIINVVNYFSFLTFCVGLFLLTFFAILQLK